MNPLVTCDSPSGGVWSALTSPALIAGTGMYMMLTLVMLVSQAKPFARYRLAQPVTSVLGSRMTMRLRTVMSPNLLLPLGCLL